MIICKFVNKEYNLCKNLQLSCNDYLLIKDMLIRESIKEGIISKSFLDNSFKIGNLIKLFYLLFF
jgi:hypothetical protein